MYSKCIDCPNHKVIADPDLDDWFNADDEAIVCLLSERISSNPINSKSKYAVDRQKHRPIDVGIRPYQIKNVNVPCWCPVSVGVKRDERLNEILN